MKNRFDTAIVAFAMFLATHPAYAYIDPGSGSMIMTAILGIIAAIGYTVRKYFYKLKNLFCKGKNATADQK